VNNLTVVAIKFFITILSTAVASSGICAVIVDPELPLTLAVSHRTLGVSPRTPTVGVEGSRAQHGHRAQLGQTLEAPSISGICYQDLILLTLHSAPLILSTISHVRGNFGAVKRLHASVVHKQLRGTATGSKGILTPRTVLGDDR